MSAYYNENDGFAAGWLRELIKRGVIEDGKVDERSITEVAAGDLREFTHCHFFAGIGVWAYALGQAGWPSFERAHSETVRVWTGSCPCQPFSISGKRGGASDGRHLWPAWFALIEKCRPEYVFGEQVASDDGLAWLDLVSSDLEDAGYACGAVDTCAAGFGAPQISQRLYFVAEPASGDASDGRIQSGGEHGLRARGGNGDGAARIEERAEAGELVTSAISGSGPHDGERNANGESQIAAGRSGLSGAAFTGATRGYWEDAEWLWCRDGKYRPVEPGTFPLAHGAAARVGRLRGYGNALVAPQAIEFVRAAIKALSE